MCTCGTSTFSIDEEYEDGNTIIYKAMFVLLKQ